MKEITAIGKFRRETHWGHLKIWETEDEKGDFLGFDMTRRGEYIGEILPPEGYIPMFEYLRLTYPKITKKVVKYAMSSVGYTSMFVYVEDNDDFWAYTNHKCNTCTKSCKQSSKVEVVTCPQYEEIED